MPPHGLSRHPAPQANRVNLAKSFSVCWAVRWRGSCNSARVTPWRASHAFRDGVRTAAPLPALQWTWPAMIIAMLAGVAIALLALVVSWRAFRRTQQESRRRLGPFARDGRRAHALFGPVGRAARQRIRIGHGDDRRRIHPVAAMRRLTCLLDMLYTLERTHENCRPHLNLVPAGCIFPEHPGAGAGE